MRRASAFAALLLYGLCACGVSRPRGQMSDGERVYLAKCTSCHSAYEPGEKKPAEWRTSVAEMEEWGKVSLTREERALILSFLTGEKDPDRPVATAPSAPR